MEVPSTWLVMVETSWNAQVMKKFQQICKARKPLRFAVYGKRIPVFAPENRLKQSKESHWTFTKVKLRPFWVGTALGSRHCSIY